MFFVRTASERDLEKVRALLVETWHATYDTFYGVEKVNELTGRWHSLPALKARLERKNAEFLVADDGTQHRRHGLCVHVRYVEEDRDPPPALRPAENASAKGIGRDIFAELETCFPDAERMRVEVEPQNLHALAFYRAHGFSEVGQTSDCGDDQSGLPALILEKPLV